MKKFLVLFVVALAMAAAFAVPALADNPPATTTPNTTPPYAGCQGWGAGYCPAFSLADQTALERVAAALNLSVEQLTAQLNQGQSIAQIATAQQVELSAVVAAAIAPQVEALTAQVASGALTQAQADAIIALLESRVTAAFQDAGYAYCPAFSGTVPPGSGYGYGCGPGSTATATPGYGPRGGCPMWRR